MKRLLLLAMAMGLTFWFGQVGCGGSGSSSGGGEDVLPWPEWPESGMVSIAFEDLPIGAGNDYDYNDFITDVTVVGTYTLGNLAQLELKSEARARGSGYRHDFHLLIRAGTFGSDGTYTVELYEIDGTLINSISGSFPGSTDLDLLMFDDTWVAQPGWNTSDGSGVGPGRVTKFFLNFNTPFPFDLGVPGDPLFFDSYLYVWDTGEYIRFTDQRVIVAPTNWEWSEETADIWTVYPYNSTSGEGVISGNPPSFTTYWYTETPTDNKWNP
jgi:hypothetical protein